MKTLTKEDRLVIYEAARIVLSDAEIFDEIADKMDMADSELLTVRDKLQEYMKNE